MAVPTAPVIEKLLDFGDGRVLVRVSCVDPVTGFKIYRDATTNPTTLRVSPTTNNAFDTGLSPSTLYFYRAKATNGDGDSGFSANAKIDVGTGAKNVQAIFVPRGGTTGQVLTKVSDVDYDIAWADLP